jgi:hypothetical protein
MYNGGYKKATMSCSNCDLYYELFQLIQAKRLKVSVKWMPSHLKDKNCKKIRPDHVSDLDICGNDLADKYAEESAVEAQVPSKVASECLFHYSLVKRIQWRIITVISNLPDRKFCKTVRTVKEHTQDLDDVFNKSKHDLTRDKDRYSCRNCLENFNAKDKSFMHWLSGNCARIPSRNKPTPFDGLIHIGNQNIHHSHNMFIHQMVKICSKCGCKSGDTVLKKLALPCEPPTEYGLASLAAIHKLSTSSKQDEPQISKKRPLRTTTVSKRKDIVIPHIINGPILAKSHKTHSLPSSSSHLELPRNSFDDSECESWIDDIDQCELSATEPCDFEDLGNPVEMFVDSSTIPVASSSQTVTPGFCNLCGDSLSTEMHLIHGPCDKPCQVVSSSNLNHVTIDVGLSQRPRVSSTSTPSNNGICAVCGDSLSTPMHLANGPCI